MQIQVNAADQQTRGIDPVVVRAAVDDALGRFEHRITRVEVHVSDSNGPRGGNDKQCRMEARRGGLDPMSVTAEAADVYAAVNDAAGKLARMIQGDLDKRTSHR